MSDVTDPISRTGWTSLWQRPSVLFLVLMNLIPLVGLVWMGWDVGALMLIYWLETIIIGLFNLPKLLSCGMGRDGFGLALLGNLFVAAFFTVHYGLFNSVHFTFLNRIFDLPPIGRDLSLAVGGLALGHAVSLLVNWFGKGEYRDATLQAQMMKPYGRVVAMHVSLLLGGAFVLMSGGGQSLVPLILLVAVKTGMDIVAHAASHGWITLKRASA